MDTKKGAAPGVPLAGLFLGPALWVAVLLLPWWRVTEYHDDKPAKTWTVHLFAPGALGKEYHDLSWQTAICGVLVAACLLLALFRSLRIGAGHRADGSARLLIIALLGFAAAFLAAATWDQGRRPGFFFGEGGGVCNGFCIVVDAWPTWGWWIDVAGTIGYVVRFVRGAVHS